MVATGEMGAAVARVLREGGADVVTALAGRSARTRALAAAAGVVDAGDVANAVAAATVFLSIVPPSQARRLAEAVAAALRARPHALLYVDCNAVAPSTAKEIGSVVTGAGATFVDAAIIGFPPQPGPQVTRFYVAGPAADSAVALGECGLDVRIVGAEVGQASALKACYAALSKGLTAIGVISFTAAARSGLAGALLDELQHSQPALLAWLERMVPASAPKSYRWIAEMEEISLTFASAELGSELFTGVADLYRSLTETGPGSETPENRRPRTLVELAGELAAQLPPVGRTHAAEARR